MKTKLYSILILLFSLVSSFCQPRQESIWTVVGSPEGVFKAPAGSVAVDILLGTLYTKTTPQTSATGWTAIAGSGSVVINNFNGTATNLTIQVDGTANSNTLLMENKDIADSNWPFTVFRLRKISSNGLFSIEAGQRVGTGLDPNASDNQTLLTFAPVDGTLIFFATNTIVSHDLSISGNERVYGTNINTSASGLIAEASAPGYQITSIASRDAFGNATSATVLWHDGSGGTYTATAYDTAFPYYVDSYTVTHSVSGKTVTQAAVTRDSSGYISTKPALTVAP